MYWYEINFVFTYEFTNEFIEMNFSTENFLVHLKSYVFIHEFMIFLEFLCESLYEFFASTLLGTSNSWLFMNSG